MNVYLVDGTYELFRQFFGRPSHLTKDLEEVGAVRGALGSTLQMIEDGATHLGVATDHVIESFRNELWAGYKTGEGIEPTLFSQFPLFEEALVAMGIATWPMIELEADDGLASACNIALKDKRVDQVVIMTPDKDLSQCVTGDRVVQFDRRNDKTYNEAGVFDKFGVEPESIPDYLALVGDSADGFPGIPGWGAKSASTVLSKFLHIEDIPLDAAKWGFQVRSSYTLTTALKNQMSDALLFKDLATLRFEAPLFKNVDEIRWGGPTSDFEALCERIDGKAIFDRAERLAAKIDSAS